MRKTFLLWLLLLLPSAAWAQCTGGLINNCPAAVSPLPGDFVLGWQNSQSPHTRKITNAQVVTGALGQPLTVPLSTLPSRTTSAGLNLGIGAPPASCRPGDLWMTGSGAFACPAGAPLLLGSSSADFQTYANVASLPLVGTADAGRNAYVLNCQNGSEGPTGGTGCTYTVNAVGAWVGTPSPSNLTVTIGGQSIYLGGSTSNQGNGTKIQLATGGFTAGNALISDASGNAVDGGVPPSGGSGGSGTVTVAAVNSLPFYSSSPSGSTLAALVTVPNSVLTINGSGVPSESTTLPPGLIIPSPTISAAILTGTSSIAATNMTGKLTTVASATSAAGFNVPQGFAPASPINGDIWSTAAGFFARVNGSTQGPLVAAVAGTAPVTASLAGATWTLACPTCATITNGGPLTATAPITISSGGLIALGSQPAPIVWLADSATAVHNDTYNLIEKSPWANNVSVVSMTYHTGGTNTPSFTASLQINGAPISGCNGIGVSSGTDATVTCSGGALPNLGTLSLVITGTSGSPASAVIQVNVLKPAS